MKADAGRRQQQQQPSAQGATPSKRVASTKQESQPHAPSQPQPQTKVVTEKEDASTITAPNASVAEASTSSNSHCQTELGHSYAMPAPTAYVLRGQSHPRRGQSTRGRGSARGARGNSAGNVGPPYIPFAHASATAAAGATQPEGTYYPGGMPFAETEGSYRTGMPVSPYFYNAPPQQQNWAAYPQFGYDPYLYNNANFVPPESTFTSAPVGHMPDGPTYQLLAQIEFYFSQRNLQGDFFLRNCMDSDGWVPVSTVAAFNRIKRLGADLKTVVDTLLYSTVLDVDPERMMVRKMFGWEAWVLNAAGPNGLREQQRITRYPTDHQQQSRLHSQQVQYSSQHSNGAMSFPSVQTENKRAAQQQDSVTSVSGTVGNSASSSDPLKASTTASLISSAFRHSEDGKSSLGVTDDVRSPYALLEA
ncbi:La-domain-containing protein [Tilletiaria anomala UBC 951]|uniref:La-domain-containing protein n=1 Tax=Tilletiaria anomala (strain ATCC 24038 / CBS 436.72 / UBC 951) TaxID=1037660 RepID=A0A066V0T1_TILAU|nr:La-domain-containing protein [Tilletiaria anomala UBC 951]KDN35317.1 La-domain-containing protein [Tilletiaria anomala UBC 951]